ncbi:MAG: electron transfer flavoprotein subunit beta/FixA family protein [Phycisphaerae bacterium]|nr:electron transfer flavoprotein subunit beta/FixA family protein [Phycisphaerae bacterium]
MDAHVGIRVSFFRVSLSAVRAPVNSPGGTWECIETKTGQNRFQNRSIDVALNIVVCAKQVPDTKRITGEAMKDDGTVNRGALPAIFNPEDLNALETALEIRDQHGGTVTVVTMGPPAACELLRESYYRGADRCILITDRRAAASDTLATSYILSCAVKKIGADLVLCGRQAIDGDTAQVGPQLAEKLNFALVTYLEELIDVTDKTLRLRRNIGAGWEDVTTKLPALVTVMETANHPRPYASKRLMKYKNARSEGEIAGQVKAECADESEIAKRCEALKSKGLLIESWNLDDIEADLNWCGMSGSPTKVHRIQSVVLTGGEYHEIDPSDDGIGQFVGELIQEHTIG